MSDYVPCDGCPAEATHHLCEECCHSEPDAIMKENTELRDVARAVVEAWNENEIGQVDGELIEKLAKLAGLHIQDGSILELEP